MNRTLFAAAGALLACGSAMAQIASITWRTFDGGGGTSTGGAFTLSGTIGQPDAGVLSGIGYTLYGGYWAGTGPAPCYVNCDNSTVPPVLNVNDFQCFVNLFAAADPRANCDLSTAPPILNTNDFQCFLNAFAAGCT
jgi:hypothetical protein